MKSKQTIPTNHPAVKNFLSSVFLLLLPAVAMGQNVEKISCRVVCFARNNDKIEKLALRVPEQQEVISEFPVSHISGMVTIPVVGGKAVFYDAASADGPPVAIATIPPDIKNTLIIFFPSPTNGQSSYSTWVLDFSKKGIPDDGVLVSNVSTKDARIIIGEHKILLRPGKLAPLLRPKELNEYNMAKLEIQIERNGQWETATQTVIKFPKGLRQLFVAYFDERKASVSFRTYKVTGL